MRSLNLQNEVRIYFRQCTRCNEFYRTSGRFSKCCEDCKITAGYSGGIKRNEN